MTDIVLVALIAAIPSALIGVAALTTSIRTKDAVKEVHISINSRMSQLLDETRASSFANGVKTERERTDTVVSTAVAAAVAATTATTAAQRPAAK